MKEHPILFSPPMIRALLEGRKTVTRRLSKRWLKVKAGDRLWVREQLSRPDGDPWLYSADGQPVMVDAADETTMLVWAHHKDQDYCPSIHMPRWASRITLEAVADARAERLHWLTEKEARDEGIEEKAASGLFRNYGPPGNGWPSLVNPVQSFITLWRSLHTKPGERWEDNPEVVRIAFAVLQEPLSLPGAPQP